MALIVDAGALYAQADRNDPDHRAVIDLLQAELGLARDVARRYRDLELGLADASLVVLAHRHRTRRLLTLDERCFRAVTPLQGGSFRLLPHDR